MLENVGNVLAKDMADVLDYIKKDSQTIIPTFKQSFLLSFH